MPPARPEASAEKYVSLSMRSAAFASPSDAYDAVASRTSAGSWTSSTSAAAAGRTGTSFARAARPRSISSW